MPLMPFHKVGVDHLFVKILGAHNAESKHTKLTSLLIDDIIAVDAGSLVSEITYEEQEKIKTILLSHGHYDHIRAIPSFAFNNRHQTTKVYSTTQTFKILSSHLIDGVIYPEFTKKIPFGKTSPCCLRAVRNPAEYCLKTGSFIKETASFPRNDLLCGKTSSSRKGLNDTVKTE